MTGTVQTLPPLRPAVALSALLACALLAPTTYAVELETTVEAAIEVAPPVPVAAQVFEVRLASDLLASQRILRLVDGVRGDELARRPLGRLGIRTYGFRIPEDIDAIVVELLEGDAVVLRWPEFGAQPVARASATSTAAAHTPPAGGPVADASTSADVDCRNAPQDDSFERSTLRAWLDACPLDSAALAARDLSGVDLAGRDLSRADLRGAVLTDANLSGADLTGALLSDAMLAGADLSSATLLIADLARADLFVADLGGADLRDADLSGASLLDANLSGADLLGARLTGAQLDAADFSGARCPDGTQTEDACGSRPTSP